MAEHLARSQENSHGLAQRSTLGDPVPENCLSGGRGGGAGTLKVREVELASTTKTAVRRSRPANPLKIGVEKKTVSIALKTRKFTTHSRREGQLFRCQFWDLVSRSWFLTLSAHTLSCQSDKRSKELASLLEFAKSDEQTVCCFTRLGRVGTSGFSTFP